LFKNFLIKKDYLLYKKIFKNYYFFKKFNIILQLNNSYLFNNNLLNKNMLFNLNSLFKFNFDSKKINNKLPLFALSDHKDKIFKKFKNNNNNNFVNLFNLFFLNFFEFFLNKNIFFKISNNLSLKKINKLSFFLKNYSNNIKFQKFLDLNEMIEILSLVFIFKDLIFFKN
jgi:hypothetical protein